MFSQQDQLLQPNYSFKGKQGARDVAAAGAPREGYPLEHTTPTQAVDGSQPRQRLPAQPHFQAITAPQQYQQTIPQQPQYRYQQSMSHQLQYQQATQPQQQYQQATQPQRQMKQQALPQQYQQATQPQQQYQQATQPPQQLKQQATQPQQQLKQQAMTQQYQQATQPLQQYQQATQPQQQLKQQAMTQQEQQQYNKPTPQLQQYQQTMPQQKQQVTPQQQQLKQQAMTQQEEMEQVKMELEATLAQNAMLEEQLQRLKTLYGLPENTAGAAGAYTAGLTPTEVATHLGIMYDQLSSWVARFKPLKDAYKSLPPVEALASVDRFAADVAASLKIEDDSNLIKYLILDTAMRWLYDNLFSCANSTESALRDASTGLEVDSIWLHQAVDRLPVCKGTCRSEIRKKVSELHKLVFELSYEAQIRSPDELQHVYVHLAELLYRELMGKFGMQDTSSDDAVQQLSGVIRHTILAVTLVRAIGKGGEFTRTDSMGSYRAAQGGERLGDLLFRVGEDQQVERALGSPTWKQSERVLLSVCPGYVQKDAGGQQQGVCHVKEKVVTVVQAKGG